jgi:hypothetical protein
MSQAIAAWLEADADRSMNRQRAQTDSAKLVATFVVGVVGVIVAASLQLTAPPVAHRQLTAWLLATSVALTVLVIILDRISEADHEGIITEARIRNWGEDRLLQELRLNTITASKDNQKVLHEVWIGLLVQFAAATSCGAIATIGMLSRS